MKIEDARFLPPAAQEDIRKKAVQAVIEGKRQIEVAKIFGVTRQAVGKWIKKYRRDGEKSLKAKQKGRPKGSALLSLIHISEPTRLRRISYAVFCLKKK